jgi:hypothetical protein
MIGGYMTKNKLKHVQSLFRRIRGMSLKAVGETTGHQQNNLSLHEQLKETPKIKTIINVSNALQINPKILFYAYGSLPQRILDMIKSDPFYYMDKLEKLYYNHEKRYGGEDVDLNKLNAARAFEYIVKESKDGKDEKE